MTVAMQEGDEGQFSKMVFNTLALSTNNVTGQQHARAKLQLILDAFRPVGGGGVAAAASTSTTTTSSYRAGRG